MKQKKELLIFILIWVCIFGAWIFYLKRQLNDNVKHVVDQIESERAEVYNEPGFYNLFSVEENDQDVAGVTNIIETEFEKLEGISECKNGHLDIYREDAETFFESKLEGWQPGGWDDVSYSYYSIDYKDGTSDYHHVSTYFSMEDMTMEVNLNADAASDRLHSIGMFLPYKENMKQAFSETVELLGMSEAEGKRIFDKMYETLDELGDNQRISYIQDGFNFYLLESDYDDFDKMKKDKWYYMSISLASEAEIDASEKVVVYYPGENTTRAYFDIQKETAETFCEMKIEEWGFGEWERKERCGDFQDCEVFYYKKYLDDNETDKKICICLDEVSERVYQVAFQIGDESKTKRAFCEVVEWLGIPLDNAGNIYDQLYGDAVEADTNDAEMFQNGYRFYIAEVDYDDENIDEIVYWVSISTEL